MVSDYCTIDGGRFSEAQAALCAVISSRTMLAGPRKLNRFRAVDFAWCEHAAAMLAAGTATHRRGRLARRRSLAVFTASLERTLLRLHEGNAPTLLG
jgi:hypothetical protein